MPDLIVAAGKRTTASKDCLLGIYFARKEAEKVKEVSKCAIGRADEGKSMNKTLGQGRPRLSGMTSIWGSRKGQESRETTARAYRLAMEIHTCHAKHSDLVL